MKPGSYNSFACSSTGISLMRAMYCPTGCREPKYAQQSFQRKHWPSRWRAAGFLFPSEASPNTARSATSPPWCTVESSMPRNDQSPIRDPQVTAVLNRLHAQAGRQLPDVVAHIAGRALRGLLSASSAGSDDTAYYRDKLIPIDRHQGELMYLLCRSLNAQRIVEYGTSFGVSTLYLASAIRDNGGDGVVIGTELEPTKAGIARKNFEEAGLSRQINLREGDALETLKDCGGPVDFLLVDGWPKLAIPVLRLV